MIGAFQMGLYNDRPPLIFEEILLYLAVGQVEKSQAQT